MRRKLSFAVLALAIVVAPAGAQTLGFTIIDGALNTVDLETAELELIGDSGFTAIARLAFGPEGTLYAISSRQVEGMTDFELVVLDPATGAGTLVGSLGIGDTDDLATIGLAVDAAGLIWLVLQEFVEMDHRARLYRVDPGTAAATLVGESEGIFFGLAERDGTLYSLRSEVVGGAKTLVTIDSATGDLGPGLVQVGGLIFDPYLSFDSDGGLWIMGFANPPITPPQPFLSITQLVGLPDDSQFGVQTTSENPELFDVLGLAIPPAEGSIVTVPTLSTFGLAALVLLIFSAAVLTFRRQRV